MGWVGLCDTELLKLSDYTCFYIHVHVCLFAVGVAKTHGVFGHGTGPIAVRDAQCTGLESTLSSCQYSTNTDSCSHGNDAGVKCYNASTSSDVCALGDIRLVGGAGVNEGSVEVCLDNEWGTVCDDEWDSIDTGVLCTQLGYSYGEYVDLYHTTLFH